MLSQFLAIRALSSTTIHFKNEWGSLGKLNNLGRNNKVPRDGYQARQEYTRKQRCSGQSRSMSRSILRKVEPDIRETLSRVEKTIANRNLRDKKI